MAKQKVVKRKVVSRGVQAKVLIDLGKEVAELQELVRRSTADALIATDFYLNAARTATQAEEEARERMTERFNELLAAASKRLLRERQADIGSFRAKCSTAQSVATNVTRELVALAEYSRANMEGLLEEYAARLIAKGIIKGMK